MSEPMEDIQQTTNPPTPLPIPPLVTIGPVIFVPLTEDLLSTPFEPPPMHSDRLKLTLENLTSNAARVRANLLGMYRLECARIEREAQEQEDTMIRNHNEQQQKQQQEAQALGQEPLPIEPHQDIISTPRSSINGVELADMLSRMDEPVVPSKDYNLKNAEIPIPDFSTLPERTPRETAYKELMMVVTRALKDLRDFDAHVARSRAPYERALKRAQEKEAAC